MRGRYSGVRDARREEYEVDRSNNDGDAKYYQDKPDHACAGDAIGAFHVALTGEEIQSSTLIIGSTSARAIEVPHTLSTSSMTGLSSKRGDAYEVLWETGWLAISVSSLCPQSGGRAHIPDERAHVGERRDGSIVFNAATDRNLSSCKTPSGVVNSQT